MSIIKSSAPEHLPGAIVATDHYITCPLDHFTPSSTATITVYIREVVAEKHATNAALPLLVYLQGGPGFPSPRLTAPTSGWLKSMLADYRVLLLDQRGTGLSSALTAQTCGAFASDAAGLAEYLTHFRADSIVHDVELFRQTRYPGQKLTLLGQSFGGFCILSYVSFFPDSLERLLFTCGLAPVHATAQEVYEATYVNVIERNRRYYVRYPSDKVKVAEIVQHLRREPVKLPSGGGILTARRFLMLGLSLGTLAGMETLHYLLETAWVSHFHSPSSALQPTKQLSHVFLTSVASLQSSFDTNPMFWFMHETIYCDGPKYSPSNWAAETVHHRTTVRGEALFDPSRFDELDHAQLVELATKAPVYFSGEMVFSWMAEDFPETLGPFRDAANILAKKTDWRPLYNEANLRDIAIPTAALVSYDDLYVDRTLSMRTAALLGDNCHVFVSNEYQHAGIRDDPTVVEKLLKMSKGEVIVPT
ncbi:hypothetical protein H310_07385 [Aphanomyces invadans]|nr:hypothetical protein H310_07385 [Aphanomyces invadans]ETW00863.1 hypothetical protein H310_07385 [Aphanomyces invadans]|eukprot:XP_008870998.1 hypothetical protein H310_07385 [Aphanomyces invadans]